MAVAFPVPLPLAKSIPSMKLKCNLMLWPDRVESSCWFSTLTYRRYVLNWLFEIKAFSRNGKWEHWSLFMFTPHSLGDIRYRRSMHSLIHGTRLIYDLVHGIIYCTSLNLSQNPLLCCREKGIWFHLKKLTWPWYLYLYSYGNNINAKQLL